MNSITAKPSRDFQAQASLSYGSFDTITGEAAIGGPISDAARFRISGTGTHSNGYVHNLLTGRRENGQGSFALRGQLAAAQADWSWQPASGISLAVKRKRRSFWSIATIVICGNPCCTKWRPAAWMTAWMR